MLLFSLLAKAVEKLEQINDSVVEKHFAHKGCSSNDFDCRLKRAEQALAKLKEQNDQAKKVRS